MKMPSYITRVSIWFNSEGASPKEVIKKLTMLGFTPVRGVYDFIYKHDESIQMTDAKLGNAILDISNALHAALKGFKVLYTLDTHPVDDTDDYFPLEIIDAELEATSREIREVEREAHLE